MSTRKDTTRARLLEAAWRRLERGDPARLEDVAADAGVSRQAVYLHFGARSGLLLALVDHIDGRLGLYAQLEKVTAIADPAARLEASIGLTADYQPRIHGVGMAMLRAADTDPEIRAAFEDRMTRRRAELTGILEALRARRRLVAGWSVREIADILWAAGSPSSYEQLVVQRGWKLARYRRWLQSLARSFVTSRPRSS
jgi:AcrR family transcriptional regulator